MRTETQILHLTLTPQESSFLANLLQTALKETRIEEHRTRTPLYREHVLEKERLIEAVLEKLGE